MSGKTFDRDSLSHKVYINREELFYLKNVIPDERTVLIDKITSGAKILYGPVGPTPIGDTRLLTFKSLTINMRELNG